MAVTPFTTISRATRKFSFCPSSTSAARTVFTDWKGINVPALTVTSFCAYVCSVITQRNSDRKKFNFFISQFHFAYKLTQIKLLKVNEKTWESVLHLSSFLALALPSHRISNAKSPRQRPYIGIPKRGHRYNNLTRPFRCRIFCGLNFARIRNEKIMSVNVLF